MRGKRKKLGQHFLASQAVAERIANAMGASPEDLVLEIGPGKGALTGPLLDTGARVMALELDLDLHDRLKKSMGGNERLELVRGNALRFDYAKVPEPFMVASNLPYSVAVPVIKRLVESKERISSMVLMTQEEVARRLTARAGEPGYGSLSLYTGFHCAAEYLFNVPPESFRPRPKVESGVIRLTPRKEPPVKVDSEERFFKMIHTAFAHKRKTIKNNLSRLWPEVDMFLEALAQAGVNPEARAEEISIERFSAIYSKLPTVGIAY